MVAETGKQLLIRQGKYLRAGGIAGHLIGGVTHSHPGLIKGQGIVSPNRGDLPVILLKKVLRLHTILRRPGLRLTNDLLGHQVADLLTVGR